MFDESKESYSRPATTATSHPAVANGCSFRNPHFERRRSSSISVSIPHHPAAPRGPLAFAGRAPAPVAARCRRQTGASDPAQSGWNALSIDLSNGYRLPENAEFGGGGSAMVYRCGTMHYTIFAQQTAFIIKEG